MTDDDAMHEVVQAFAERQPRLGDGKRTVACVHIYAKGDVLCKQAGWQLAVEMKDCGHLPLPVLCRKCRRAGDVQRDEQRVRLIERDRMAAARKRHRGPIDGQLDLDAYEGWPDDVREK